jgi:hypothetical protein
MKQPPLRTKVERPKRNVPYGKWVIKSELRTKVERVLKRIERMERNGYAIWTTRKCAKMLRRALK